MGETAPRMKNILFLVCVCALPGAYSTDVKYNPGHYVALEAGANLEAFPYLQEPAIRGFNIRYSWADLEPEPNRYDFSALRRDLKTAAAHRKQLVAFLTDKTFSPRSPHPLPVHLRAYALTNSTGGITPKKWDRRLIERNVALAEALAREFDSHPNFEGIAWQESAPSLPRAQLEPAGYTPELFRDGLIRMLAGSSEALRRSQVFWYQNFVPMRMEYLREITVAVLPYRVVLGGPDILPYRTGLKPSYDLYEEFRGKLKLSSSAQADSYRHHRYDTDNSAKAPYHQGLKPIHPEGYVTMEQIFEFGRDRLHLNYIFWSYIRSRPKQYPGDPQAFVFEDALKVIRRHPTFNRPH